ncbi:hypothetical protein C2G38_2288028 [Gigaspora rosea]|uniref:Uncharacterized protein n=1 Tax=Gigaspora rosea TaxID=44941 RepID=A0A397VMU6_9GLOM|nr:hypothetical protein C2G38_2288028 [Gigaspora rosea]
MLMKILTLEQMEEVQEIINENFSRPPNDEQLLEVLVFVLEAVENIIRNHIEKKEKEIEYIPSLPKVSPQEALPIESWQKRKNSIEAFDPYYAAGKSCDVMQDQGCISKSELNDLINEYLEDFDNLIPKSRKDEPCILGNYNRNGIVVPALKKPSKWPRTRPTVVEVLDTYYVPDEPEKKSPRDVALGLEIDLKPFKYYLANVTTFCKDGPQKKKNIVENPGRKIGRREAGNIDEMDENKRIGVEKDEEKDELDETEILADPNYI